ncbi:hypothetical protein AB6A40_005977 [Gnathostoma spinigerum]|uniref:UDP-N-acetylglucosamine transferase subunit ALG13 n=1 Tax=Gnathostoma spinigerum TaxID=75299 RepID=A0ABD6EH09_9BILA
MMEKVTTFHGNRCFVTVGSTRFDSLIQQMVSDEVVSSLKAIGISEVVMQIGHSQRPSHSRTDDGCYNVNGVFFMQYRHKPSIGEDIDKADLVIGHAGAATCTEVLSRSKPLICVFNESLMDNHQMELAGHLYAMQCVGMASPESLCSVITSLPSFKFLPFERPDLSKVAKEIDRVMGYADSVPVE